MSMNLIPLYFYFMVLSFIASLTAYSNSNPENNYLKWWPPFLFLTLLVELSGSYLYLDGKNNTFIYNSFSIVEFPFYMANLSFFVRKPLAKKIIRYTAVLYAVITLINMLFIQGIMTFNSITFALGCLLIASFCVYYFLELFRSPKAIKLKNDPAFWICTGLLFFYCVSFPFFALANLSGGLPKILLKHFQTIVTILNCFLYTLFTIAFLCNRTRNYSSSSS